MKTLLKIVFISYFITPLQILRKYAICKFQAPYQAEIFGTIFNYITLFDLLFIAIGIFTLIKYKAVPIGRTFGIYVVMNIISIITIIYKHGVYYDGIVEFVRVVAMYLTYMCFLIVGGRPSYIYRCILILMIITFIIFSIGYSNPNLENDTSGRLNAPGLEIATTGHVAGALLILMAFNESEGYFVRLMGIIFGISGLAISGSRLPLIISMCFVIMITIYRSTKVISFRNLGIAVLMLAIIWSGIILFSNSPTIGRMASPSVLLTDYSVLGRLLAWNAANKILDAYPMGLYNSDWIVQEQLAKNNYPSHCHNAYIQLYLKYGLMLIPFVAFLIISILKGIKMNNSCAFVLLYMITCWIFDYPLFVTKYSLILFILIFDNELINKRHDDNIEYYNHQLFGNERHRNCESKA
jgi:hypothetical protein